ncbi:hypothetical protein ACHAXR_000321, partial [Thalassiosira sp. AJA248-18]
EQFDAIIIGAGWAGIKAATTLLDAGVSNILVLEANDYIGGRSKSVNSDGTINDPNIGDFSNVPVEMGSEWLYIEGNEMEDYLKDNGFLNGIDVSDGKATFVPVKDSPFYMQTLGDNNTLTTARMDIGEVNDLHKRVWGGFLSFRKELLKGGRDLSYLSAARKYQREVLKSAKDIQYVNLVLAAAEVDYAAKIDKLSLSEHRVFDGYLGKAFQPLE